MPDRIAIKRLTSSDLTFFESLFRKLNAGNQKAINLNADVFIEDLYPALPTLVETLSDVIPVTLTILGPAGSGAHVISRAVTKRDAYKNWRLNGEFVRDPEGETGRFDMLKAGDLAVMEFVGDPGPQRITFLLIAADSPVDAPLHAALNVLVPGGRKTMVQVSRGQIAAAATAAPPTHPIWMLAADPEFDAALEDAALGGIKGSRVIRAKVAKIVTAAALAAARASAERVGRDGEALAWIHLQKLKLKYSWLSIEWASRTNAVAPFDFKFVDKNGVVTRIDAKSTNGEFERMIHMSSAELIVAGDGGRYVLWRLYAINDDGAKIRISNDIGAIANTITAATSLPNGITVDSVSIDPAILEWGPEVLIEPLEDAPDDT